MRFDLNLPPGVGQSAFQLHFNASVRAIQESSFGSAAFQPDGSFVATSTDRINSGGIVFTAEFALHTSPVGVLTHVEVGLAEDVTSECQSVITSLVTTALANALSGKKQRFFTECSYRSLA